MNIEEKKALEWLKKADWFSARLYAPSILNLIEKQSKEIEEYKKQLDLDYVDKHFVPVERYNQLEKEIEELKEERKKYPIAMNDEQYKKVIELAQKDIKEELDRQINVRMINEEYIERNYISKDKIKAKIEKLDEEIKVKREIAKNPMDRVSGRLLTDSIVELEKTKKVLQSLLEKE